MKKSTKIISLIMMVILLLNSSMVGVFALSPTYTPSASYKNSEYYRKLCAVNLTGNQVDDIISVALSQEGYYESNSAEQLSGANLGSGTYNNYTEYGAWFGKGKNGTTGWCAIFISWCAAQAQVPTSVIEKTANATAQSFCNNYYDFGEITPQKGDILALHKTDPEHVGLIYDVDDNFIYAIEGNMRSGGTRVSKVKYIKSSGKRTWDNGKSDDGKQIVRIARPDYSGNASTPTYSASVVLGKKYNTYETSLTVKKSSKEMIIELSCDYIDNGKVFCNSDTCNRMGDLCLCAFYVDDFDSSTRDKLDSSCHTFIFELNCYKKHNKAEWIDLINDTNVKIEYSTDHRQFNDGRRFDYGSFIAGWDRLNGREDMRNLTYKCSGNTITFTLKLNDNYAFNDSQIAISEEHWGSWQTRYDNESSASILEIIFGGIASFFSGIIYFFKNLFMFG